ncbi:hypothetical protein ACVI1I_006209 [Bradyrhizobium sp. USDA 4459]
MAAHSGTAVLPARPRKPRDKAKVEPAVLIIERWLLGRLRHRVFYSLAEVNAAIGELLTRLNEERALTQSDKDVASGLLQVAVANPGTRQAFYCLEHQIGGTMPAPVIFAPRPGETFAEWLGLTWIRFYGVTTLSQKPDQGVFIWVVGQTDPQLDIEQYARKGPSDQWYSAKPSYSIPIDSFDSRDIQRLQGQDHPSRVRDIESSPKWHDFLANRFPAAKQQLANNNQLRVNVKFASDVIAAVRAARSILSATFTGRIMAIAEAAQI